MFLWFLQVLLKLIKSQKFKKRSSAKFRHIPIQHFSCTLLRQLASVQNSSSGPLKASRISMDFCLRNFHQTDDVGTVHLHWFWNRIHIFLASSQNPKRDTICWSWRFDLSSKLLRIDGATWSKVGSWHQWSWETHFKHSSCLSVVAQTQVAWNQVISAVDWMVLLPESLPWFQARKPLHRISQHYHKHSANLLHGTSRGAKWRLQLFWQVLSTILHYLQAQWNDLSFS